MVPYCDSQREYWEKIYVQNVNGMRIDLTLLYLVYLTKRDLKKKNSSGLEASIYMDFAKTMLQNLVDNFY